MTALRSLCVLGDINVDVVADLSTVLQGDMAQIAAAKHVRASVAWRPGGTGAAVAAAARALDVADVRLVGKVGRDAHEPRRSDLGGRHVLEWLEGLGVHLAVTLCAEAPTGTVMISFFGEDARIMVADAGANRTFCNDDLLPSIRDAVATSEVFFVSGYALTVPERAAAVDALMELVRTRGGLVVLDVVPHQIHREIAPGQFEAMLRNVDFLVSEVATLGRLLFSSRTEAEQVALPVEDAWARVSRECPAALLRTSNETQYLCVAGRVPVASSTGYSAVPVEQRRGFSERATLTILVDSYECLRTAAQRARATSA